MISQAQGSETKAYPATSGYGRLGGFATILFLYYNIFSDMSNLERVFSLQLARDYLSSNDHTSSSF